LDNAPATLLEVHGLEKRFGGIVALSDYHIEIQPGELVGLIGPNGAGKTTVFNLLSGVLKPTNGRISYFGRDITRLRPDQKAAVGIARTFQNIRLFSDLSVIDNVKVAFHMRMGSGLWKTLFHTSGYRNAENEMEQKACEFLDLLDLNAEKNELVKNLPYGIQRRVEIARALASLPKLLLLDEPAAGLNMNETEDLVRTIRMIHDKYDLTIFLVEHDMKLVMAICERIQVIDRGCMLANGTPEEIRNNQQVIEAYLGKSSGGGRAEN
jgi:branched-chain amino acid transport system ATP-binding protein